MNTEMSTTKDNALWEDENLTELEKNCLNNKELEQNDITKNIEINSTTNQWKDIGKISGIYKIINKVNGKYYVGSSNDIILVRWPNHKHYLNNQSHKNEHLQKAWNLYGRDNFIFKVVEEVEQDKLLIIEQKYLDIAKTEPHKCYNKKFIAGGGSYGEVSKETRLKHSEKTKGSLNPKYNSTIFTFKHKITGEIYKDTKYGFIQRTKCDRKSINRLVTGKCDSVKKWVILDEKINNLRKLNKKPRKSDYVFTEKHKKNLRISSKLSPLVKAYHESRKNK